MFEKLNLIQPREISLNDMFEKKVEFKFFDFSEYVGIFKGD